MRRESWGDWRESQPLDSKSELQEQDTTRRIGHDAIPSLAVTSFDGSVLAGALDEGFFGLRARPVPNLDTGRQVL